MKYYKIKIKNTDIYVDAVIIGGEPKIQIIPSWEKETAAIFEEDKAKGYLKMLNENHKLIEYELEEVER